MQRPPENIRTCPTCRIPIACDEQNIVPKHGRRIGVGIVPCGGVGKEGDEIKEKKK